MTRSLHVLLRVTLMTLTLHADCNKRLGTFVSLPNSWFAVSVCVRRHRDLHPLSSILPCFDCRPLHTGLIRKTKITIDSSTLSVFHIKCFEAEIHLMFDTVTEAHIYEIITICYQCSKKNIALQVTCCSISRI